MSQMNLSLSLRSQLLLRGASAFSPASLFAPFADDPLTGTWDVVSPETVFTNGGGTQPALPGNTVHRYNMQTAAAGGHYLQGTAAARPVYGVRPRGGIRNLVNAGRNLSMVRATTTPEALIVNGEPFTLYTEDTSLAAAGQRFAGEVLTTYNAGDTIVISGRVVGNGRHIAFTIGNVASATFNTTTGQVSSTGGAGFIAAGVAPDGRFWIKGQFPTTAVYQNQYRLIQNPAVTFQPYDGDGVSGVYVGRRSIEFQSADAPHGPSPEQIRLSAFNIIEPTIPLADHVHYLQGDGVDDFMASAAALDLSGFDSATMIWAGERLLNTGGTHVFANHGHLASNNMLAVMKFNSDAQFTVQTREGGVFVGVGGFAAPPRVEVISATIQRGANSRMSVRRNGVLVPPENTTALTGNMLDAIISILGRTDGLSPAHTRHTGLFLCGGVLPPAALQRVERYFARKIGVTI